VDRVIDLLRELVATPSLSGQEAEVAGICEAALRRRGFDVHTDPLGNVVGMRGDSGPLLLFDAHCDTVAPGDGWTRDPYDPAVVDGRVYGRGTTDMKGPIAALIHGVARADPANRVAISITTLEETAEGATLDAVCNALTPQAVVIAEPSACVPALAQKGRAEFLVRVAGRLAHAAFPDRGRSALLDAARVLLAAEARLPASDDELGDALLVPTEATSFPRPGISVVPDRCELRFDRRLLPGEERDAVLGELRALCAAAGADATVEVSSAPVMTYTGVELTPERWLAAWRTPAESPLARAATEAVRSAAVTAYRFCTNGSATAARGIPTIGYGPGLTDLAHQPDEWISLEQLDVAAAGYAALAEMRDWHTEVT
jgi:putative selenium metabolism hydrolase